MSDSLPDVNKGVRAGSYCECLRVQAWIAGRRNRQYVSAGANQCSRRGVCTFIPVSGRSVSPSVSRYPAIRGSQTVSWKLPAREDTLKTSSDSAEPLAGRPGAPAQRGHRAQAVRVKLRCAREWRGWVIRSIARQSACRARRTCAVSPGSTPHQRASRSRCRAVSPTASRGRR